MPTELEKLNHEETIQKLCENPVIKVIIEEIIEELKDK